MIYEEMITVDQTDWNKYEIFRRMLSGSDMEGDGAWFWLSQPDFSDEDLRLIRFEWSTPQEGWQECIPVDGEIGDIFPGTRGISGSDFQSLRLQQSKVRVKSIET